MRGSLARMERDSFFLKHRGKDCLFFVLKFHIKFDMMELKPTLFFERSFFVCWEKRIFVKW